jgi:hypothetical protein
VGYTTDFYGQFNLNKPLADNHRRYLKAFANTRRMARKGTSEEMPLDPVRLAVRLPVGVQGAYFVGGDGPFGQDHDDSIIDYNKPPQGQPGLWCQWTPNVDGTAIVWDCGEKFYDYVEWLEYIVTHFLTPWGYSLSGEVEWQGEDYDDIGKIIANGTIISVHPGTRHYDE